MEPQGIFVTALTVALLVTLMTERVGLDVLGIALMAILVLAGTLDLKSSLHGFSNHAVLTIAALYVIGEGLTRTGAVEFVANMVLAASGGSERRLILLVGLVGGSVSAFLNNTAVVVVFIPVLIGMAKDTGIPASRLLIPLAYASLLGGMCTLVGTSTNLLVSGVAEDYGLEPLGMFELSPIGVPMFLVGVVFMAITARWFLPVRKSRTTEVAASNNRTYVTELVIGPTSPLRGKNYGELTRDGPKILFMIRDEQTLSEDIDEVEIQQGDEIILEGDVSALTGMQTKLGLKLVGGLNYDPRTMTFYELAVAPHSSAVGQRIDELYLHRDVGCVLVAMFHREQEIRQRASQTVLRAGDLLLVCGDEESKQRVSSSSDFYMLTGAQKKVLLRQNARRALMITAGVVLAFALSSAFKIRQLPPSMAALLGAVAMVASGCVSARRVYRTIDWPILIFVVGTLALGEAMRETGAASVYAEGIVNSLQDYGAGAVIAGIVFLAIVINAFVSTSAVAVLLTPVAIEIARNMQSDPRPFLLAVAFGGSLAFVTPMGHQVNLMVYAPGGYKFSDFIRLGLPLSVLTWVLVSWGIVWVFDLS